MIFRYSRRSRFGTLGVVEEFREGEGSPVAFAPAPIFARETLTPELVAEVVPLLIAHWTEVAHYRDIPLDPKWDRYYQLQEIGALLVYTSRLNGRLIGYNAFFKDGHLHYRQSMQGGNDVIFIDPRERGFGRRFIAWCVEQLRAEGVQVNSYHVKVSHDWGHILAEQGFEPVEVVWCKRLDK